MCCSPHYKTVKCTHLPLCHYRYISNFSAMAYWLFCHYRHMLTQNEMDYVNGMLWDFLAPLLLSIIIEIHCSVLSSSPLVTSALWIQPFTVMILKMLWWTNWWKANRFWQCQKCFKSKHFFNIWLRFSCSFFLLSCPLMRCKVSVQLA